MPRNDALQGALPLLVLTLLARRGPLHGYAIATQIEALHDVLRVEEGSLYPALHRMEEGGLLEREDRVEGGWARNYYSATKKGL